MKSSLNRAVCAICGETHYTAQMMEITQMRPGLQQLVIDHVPSKAISGWICLKDLNTIRTEHIEHLMTLERGKLSQLERDVAQSIAQEMILSQNMNANYNDQVTRGQRIADRVASFGGSWTFILLFGAFIAVWILLNSVGMLLGVFDPYPFILLNLMLSCLAAIQAPIIMMSQNRQEAKDRLRNENDYQVNLKAEIEIRALKEKVDHLIGEQLQAVMETQQIIIDITQEILDHQKMTQ